MRNHFRRLAFRLFAHQFVAGETFDEALPKIQELLGNGFVITADILGEAVHSDAEAQRNSDAYEALIQELAKQGIPVNISIKLSALGLVAEDQHRSYPKCMARLQRIQGSAQVHQGFVRVDMEQYALKNATLRMISFLHARGIDNIGPVLQAGLYDTAILDLPDAVMRGMRIRLCKGAYPETASLAHQDKGAIRAAYVICAEQMLRRGANYPAFATHDDALIEHIKRYAEANGIPESAFEFQMLYGVRQQLQRQLLSEGYTVRIYVPFGKDWWKYFRRRMREGKKRQILALLLKSLFRQ